ncbi:MAG: class I SAM-dependent methyltransferase [Patescibacteria group bacterium]|jgi:2-polyprenyl-3-methyl-5-hydroxy-6-metoxy-1,4-benzoquinol methylase
MQQFIKEVLKYANKGKILDLGAGVGKQAEKFLATGASVTAVDKKKPKKQNQKIIWKKSRMEEFIFSSDFTDVYDVIFMQNIIQFLDKKWTLATLMPVLQRHLSKNGIIAIRTFYKNPIPPFNRAPLSLYKINTLLFLFKGWKVLFARQFKYDGPGLDGIKRRFYLSDLIVKNQKK